MTRRAVEAFQLLGIPRDSDRDTIAHAYRRLARSVHPDVSADMDAAERFAELTDAYRVATTAPAHRPAAHAPEAVPVWQVSMRPARAAPIVAGPVRVRPSGDGGGRRHG